MTSIPGGTGALAELFDALLATEPDLPALVQDSRVTTFRDWWADSSLIASGLAEQGIGRGDVVVLLLPSGHDFASCYLATLRRIADNKVPDTVVFVADLPVNATFKVDAGRLRDMAAALSATTSRLPRNGPETGESSAIRAWSRAGATTGNSHET
jgi:non-ribosomal peptide synthetase component E (peptide arylation enzyme)